MLGNLQMNQSLLRGREMDIEKDPNGLNQHDLGAKLDAGKPLPWLLISGFPTAIQEVVEVGTIGARKYTPNGWRHVQDGQNRYMEAFARHMLRLASGEVLDEQTLFHHKAHMIWNLLASLEIELNENKS